MVSTPERIRTFVYEHPARGRVLELCIQGDGTLRTAFEAMEELNAGLARHAPDCLVFHLLPPEPMVDATLLGILAHGAKAMHGAGKPGCTRIVATDVAATVLRRSFDEALRAEHFAGGPHEDLVAALAATP
jgi:hypothetical protein